MQTYKTSKKRNLKNRRCILNEVTGQGDGSRVRVTGQGDGSGSGDYWGSVNKYIVGTFRCEW